MKNKIVDKKLLELTDINEIIKYLLQYHSCTYTSLITKNLAYRHIYDKIIKLTPQLDNSHSVGERFYWIINNLTNFPKCLECQKSLDGHFKGFNNGYNQYCSPECGSTSKIRAEKIKNTCLERYGVTNPNKLPEVREKIENTNVKKYGNKCFFASDIGKETIKTSLLQNYGYEYSSQIPESREKTRKTCLERYGTINGGCASQTLEKIKNTCLERYGVESTFDLSSVQEKGQNTRYEKYGVRSMFKLPEIHKKRIEQISKDSYDNFILSNDFDRPLFTFEEYRDRSSRTQEFPFQCKKCNEIFMSQHINGQHKKCPKCYPHIQSQEEEEVKKFIEMFNVKIEQHNKIILSPYEIDIYIPEKKLAIEYDGLYWHSDDIGKNKNYHLNKTEQCEKQGIQLIHIFENEWRLKQDIVKSRLKNLLGIYDKTIFARKCQIKEIDSKTSNDFQNENHLQGSVNCNVNLGLFYDNELISLMTFSKPRFDKKHEWELVRFCNKLGYHIPGAAGKLLRHFEKTYYPKNIVSYADRRWSQGKLYEALGFKLNNVSRPNYWYFKNSSIVLESRVKYQKHNLHKLLEKFDENLSESQNMTNNGYHKIYDCGNLVFVKEYN